MLSVIIITQNEAHILADCLEAIKWADEIIIVDSGSTDNTREIAKKYTPHVFLETDWQGYGIQKQRALEKATGDWVLNVDADEIVSEALKNKLQTIMRDDAIDACRIPVLQMFNNQLLKHSGSPKRHIRFFKREGVVYEAKTVHEGVILRPDSMVIQLKEPLFHYSFRDFSDALDKLNRYSSYTAKMRIEKKRPVNLTTAIISSLWMFLKVYVIKGGFLDGKLGFIFAAWHVEGTFYRAIKQMYPDKNVDAIRSGL